MITIYIKDLIVEAKHGFHPHEKEQPQRFKINVELEIETMSVKTDNLDDTLNWSKLRDQVVDITVNNSFNLIEKLAQAIADQLLTDKRVKKVSVSIDKLDAFPNGTPGAR